MPGEIRSALSPTLSNCIAEKREQFGRKGDSPRLPMTLLLPMTPPINRIEREGRGRCDIAREMVADNATLAHKSNRDSDCLTAPHKRQQA